MEDEKYESEIEVGHETSHEQAPPGYVPSRALAVDPAAEARVVRKMDLRLVPIVTALCTLIRKLPV